VIEGVGPEAMAQAYAAVVAGEAGPDQGHVLAPQG
jgi:hypothetical protein